MHTGDNMYDNEQTISRAVLVTVDTGEFDAEMSVKELSELARTAGAETAAVVIQKRPSPDTATYIGSGRLEQLRGEAEMAGADLLIFDCELTANQTRNIEQITDIRVIDRTTLILDIFAMRAASAEGRIQVELAQQKYRLAHLAGKGVQLSRLGGGIGTRGPGETKLETDRRHIRTRIGQLEDELEQIRRHRDLIRRRRKKDNVQTAAIVGYTNAGKSTLLNALTGAGVLSEDKLFATLDVTSRALSLPDGREVLLSDTVGLIRRLPHELVNAFRSTLEEAANADIIVNVLDISSPTAKEEQEVTDKLLAELGCADIPRVTVLNKCDKLPGAENIPEDSTTVRICAKTGEGFDRLLSAVAANLPGGYERGIFTIPYDRQGMINSIIEDGGKVFSTEYTGEGAVIDALVSEKMVKMIRGE
ncbi:MAG: GTPase HflX [Oscillospiraceae bacterium]|nr:GTPase HflX [Oscillospiraceae bacterium]